MENTESQYTIVISQGMHGVKVEFIDDLNGGGLFVEGGKPRDESDHAKVAREILRIVGWTENA